MPKIRLVWGGRLPPLGRHLGFVIRLCRVGCAAEAGLEGPFSVPDFRTVLSVACAATRELGEMVSKNLLLRAHCRVARLTQFFPFLDPCCTRLNGRLGSGVCRHSHWFSYELTSLPCCCGLASRCARSHRRLLGAIPCGCRHELTSLPCCCGLAARCARSHRRLLGAIPCGCRHELTSLPCCCGLAARCARSHRGLLGASSAHLLGRCTAHVLGVDLRAAQSRPSCQAPGLPGPARGSASAPWQRGPPGFVQPLAG